MKRLYLGIDLQEGFLNDELRAGDYVDRVCKFITGLDKVDVVLTRFVNTPGNNFDELLGYTITDPETTLIGDLEKGGYEVIEKSTYSAWLPQIIGRLERDNVDELVMFGLDSHACVLKTALDAFDAGAKPVVLTDLSRSSEGKERNEQGLELIGALIGEKQLITSNKL